MRSGRKHQYSTENSQKRDQPHKPREQIPNRLILVLQTSLHPHEVDS